MTWDEAEERWPGCSIEWDVLHQNADPPEVWLDSPKDGQLWASEPRPTGDGRWTVDNWGWNPHGPDGRGEWIMFPSMMSSGRLGQVTMETMLAITKRRPDVGGT